MNESLPKSILVLSLGIVVWFFLLKPKPVDYAKTEKDLLRKTIKEPVYDESQLSLNEKSYDGIIALDAYIAAWNNYEPQEFLDELNDGLKKQYNLYVVKSENSLSVKDSATGKEIMMHEF